MERLISQLREPDVENFLAVLEVFAKPLDVARFELGDLCFELFERPAVVEKGEGLLFSGDACVR